MSRGPWDWAALRPCGTEAAYKRHKRRGETPCPQDYQAAARAAAERKQRRRQHAGARP